MQQVKAGRDLSSLERIPNPVAPPQLAVVQSMMMRPGGFYSMMSLPRAPFPMGGVMRPPPPQMGGPMGGPQQLPQMGPPVSMVSGMLCMAEWLTAAATNGVGM
jgi:hypothetical protein